MCVLVLCPPIAQMGDWKIEYDNRTINDKANFTVGTNASISCINVIDIVVCQDDGQWSTSLSTLRECQSNNTFKIR